MIDASQGPYPSQTAVFLDDVALTSVATICGILTVAQLRKVRMFHLYGLRNWQPATMDWQLE